MSQIPFHCPKTDRHVVLTRTVFGGVSGIGDDSPGHQVEHACSIEDKCPLRIEPTCPVRRLDAGT